MPKAHRIFPVFQTALLAMPAFFLLYLVGFWGIIPFYYASVLELVTFGLFLVWLFGMWKLKFPRPQFTKNQLWALIAFFGAFALSALHTTAQLEDGRLVILGISVAWFLTPLMYFLMVSSSFRSSSELKRLIASSVGIVAVLASIMVIQFYTGWFSEIQSTYDNRLIWPFLEASGEPMSANIPAIFLAPFFCLGWIMFFKEKRKCMRWFYAISIILIDWAVYLTLSYGAWLAIIGACAISSFMLLRGSKRWVLVPAVVLLLLGGIYLTQRNTEKFQFAMDISEEVTITSSSERINIWQTSWDLVKANPFWGVGPGQYRSSFAEQAPLTLERAISDKEIKHAGSPHNLFLMFWLSMGILGLLSFLWLLYAFAKPLPVDWRWFLLCPLFYLLIHGVIDISYWKADFAYSFWLIMAMMVIAQQSKTPSHSS